jgi:hypothetical protein
MVPEAFSSSEPKQQHDMTMNSQSPLWNPFSKHGPFQVEPIAWEEKKGK